MLFKLFRATLASILRFHNTPRTRLFATTALGCAESPFAPLCHLAVSRTWPCRAHASLHGCTTTLAVLGGRLQDCATSFCNSTATAPGARPPTSPYSHLTVSAAVLGVAFALLDQCWTALPVVFCRLVDFTSSLLKATIALAGAFGPWRPFGDSAVNRTWLVVKACGLFGN